MKDDGEGNRFGQCPRCHQGNRSLTWFMAGVKGTNQIVSGWMCKECFKEMKEGDENKCQRTDVSAAEQ